jgi:hypothetical protein
VSALRSRFARMLKAAEQRQRGELADAPGGWFARMQFRMLAWMAERIAEQRLLWALRGRTDAVLAHPEDMAFSDVLATVRDALRHDYERHRKWMFIDGVAFVVTFVVLGPLFLLVPGVANLPALYFGFRVVGHFLSMRGARQGLCGVTFTSRPCAPLGELREIVDLEPVIRERRVQEIASRLRLEHLGAFFRSVVAARPG